MLIIISWVLVVSFWNLFIRVMISFIEDKKKDKSEIVILSCSMILLAVITFNLIIRTLCEIIVWFM